MAYKVDVTRSEVVTVKSREINDYGDLVFTDTEEGEHKLGKKRESMFDQIIVGRAVKLDYAEYMQKEYIAVATLFDGMTKNKGVSPEKVGMPATPKPKNLGEKATEIEVPGGFNRQTPSLADEAKTRSMAIAYAKDLVVAGKIDLKEMKLYATRIVEFIYNREPKIVSEAKKLGAEKIE